MPAGKQRIEESIAGSCNFFLIQIEVKHLLKTVNFFSRFIIFISFSYP